MVLSHSDSLDDATYDEAFTIRSAALSSCDSARVVKGSSVTTVNYVGTNTSNVATVALIITNNPAPATTNLSLPSTTAGGVGFTLRVNDSNIINGSVVQWNGSYRTRTYVSSTQVTALMPASGDGSGGGVQSDIGRWDTNAQTFTINSINNPAPV